jgi:hypothetical protein
MFLSDNKICSDSMLSGNMLSENIVLFPDNMLLCYWSPPSPSLTEFSENVRQYSISVAKYAIFFVKL